VNDVVRNVVITGVSRGIGRALAEWFLDRGDHVIGLARTELQLENQRFSFVECDLSDETSTRNAIKKIKLVSKNVDVLINNAGIASMNHLALTPVSLLKKVYSVNVFGMFQLVNGMARIMPKALEGGRIVNFSTVAVPLNIEGEAAYASSKAAVEQLTKAMAYELAPMGITCNAVGPVPIQTELIAGVPGDKIEALVSRQAVKRFGTFADVINVIEFFTRKESDMITGQIIYLGGIR